MEAASTEQKIDQAKRHEALLPTRESHSAQDLAVGTLAVFC